MTPDLIAARALRRVGTPFRFFGRSEQFALDCVGLTAIAIGIKEDWRYGFKGDYLQTVSSCLAQHRFHKTESGAVLKDGDIALVQCAPRQQHLMIRANEGWVHAHAGLGHVVHMPGESPWPIIALWRISGE